MNYFPFPAGLPGQVARAARQAGQRAGQTGRLFRQLVQRTLDAVQDVLRAEIQNGHARLVVDFLTDKSLARSASASTRAHDGKPIAAPGLARRVYEQRGRVGAALLLEKLFQAARTSGLLAKIEANPTVADTLARVEELRHAASRLIFPDGETGATVLTDEEPLPCWSSSPKLLRTN